MHWTATKTTSIQYVKRGQISAEEILLNQKWRNIQTLTLEELDRSVLVSDSVLAKLEHLESLDLSYTNIVDVSALVKLTSLTSLHLAYTNVVDVSALAKLTSLKFLFLRQTNVEVSALKEILPKLKVIE